MSFSHRMLESVFLKVKPYDSVFSCNITSQGKRCRGTAEPFSARSRLKVGWPLQKLGEGVCSCPTVTRDQDHVLLSAAAGFCVYIAETKMLKDSCQTIWRGEATVEG